MEYNAVLTVFVYILFLLFSFFKDFLKCIYLTQRERETVRAGTQAGGVGEGETGFPLSRESDAGLDPRILGS